jgi:hypothetical protein
MPSFERDSSGDINLQHTLKFLEFLICYETKEAIKCILKHNIPVISLDFIENHIIQTFLLQFLTNDTFTLEVKAMIFEYMKAKGFFTILFEGVNLNRQSLDLRIFQTLHSEEPDSENDELINSMGPQSTQTMKSLSLEKDNQEEHTGIVTESYVLAIFDLVSNFMHFLLNSTQNYDYNHFSVLF